MPQFRLARISLLLAAIGLNAAPALFGMAPAQAADTAPAPVAPKEDTVRPEMFKQLDPAVIKELMAAKNYTEVQSRIDQVQALPNLTPYETFVLNRMRISLASATGNNTMAMTALEAVIESGRLQKAELGDFIQALANYHYNAKDYPKAISWFERYQKETGDAARVRPYIIRAYYFSNDYPRAKKELLSDLQAQQAAGTQPPIESLQLLANTGAKTKDPATFLIAMEQLVKYYPSDEYWTDLLSRTQSKAGYSNRFQLDIYRLERAAVSKMSAEEYTEMGELALAAGLPTESKKAMDAGFAAGVLGTGPNAAKHKKVRDQAAKSAADDAKNIGAGEASAAKSKDGNGLINLGYAYVTMDQFDKGIELIQKGIAKGGLKRPDDAKLRLGYSYAMAGRKDDAIKTLQTIQGNDGLGDLARYWILWINRPATTATAAGAAPAATAPGASAN
ncbi:MAG: tetratricopeptide repeat protein [Pseudomonadota bacterium]